MVHVTSLSSEECEQYGDIIGRGKGGFKKKNVIYIFSSNQIPKHDIRNMSYNHEYIYMCYEG